LSLACKDARHEKAKDTLYHEFTELYNYEQSHNEELQPIEYDFTVPVRINLIKKTSVRVKNSEEGIQYLKE